MTIWDPFNELLWFEGEMGQMLADIWGEQRGRQALPLLKRAGPLAEKREIPVGTPALDLIDKKESLVLRSELPGVKKTDIKVSIDDDSVSISGKVERKKEEKEQNYYYCERGYSAWQRTIPLPVNVKSEKARAKYENGVLEITLPKSKEDKERRKQIKIE